MKAMGRRTRLAEILLVLGLIVIFAFLVAVRPPLSFLVLLLAPIALGAVLYEFTGGTILALVALTGVALLVALDPDHYRRATSLKEVWPILVAYLAAGPFVGWLVSLERESKRQLATTARRLQVVQDIVRVINTTLDPQDTLQAIIAETRRLVPFERAAVSLISGKMLRIVATDEEDQNASPLVGQTFALQGSASGQVVESGEIWSGTSFELSDYADTRILCSEGESCLIIPLKFQRQVIGAYTLSGKELASVTETDQEDLVQIMDQTAIAIEHARLFRLERERALALAAISEAGREIAASLDLERTLQLVMTKAAETLPMDAGALFVFDEGDQLYRVAVSHNLPPEQVDKITFAFDEGVPGWVVKHRQPLIIDDATADDRVHPNVVEVGVKSVLSIPLITRERLFGVLNLFGKRDTKAFDGAALRLAQVYADQAAVVIENARLVDELRQAAAELEARVEQRTRELRETQAQVIRAEKMAAVGRLAASVAHEVNNPLQAITLHLQLIAEEEENPTVDEQIAIVSQELARIAEIVQRLLEFQRPKVGLKSAQDILALIDDVLALAGKQLQHSKIDVTRQIEASLSPVMAVGDQLKQVFLNLVLNAVEAMPDGGDLLIDGRQSNGTVVITFSDSGAGISAEDMPQLFEPFFSTKHTGSGLGLAVSQEIVTHHGGELGASNQKNGGAIFTVSLPAHQEIT
jgi:two-component system NtrC family sensor kinase